MPRYRVRRNAQIDANVEASREFIELKSMGMPLTDSDIDEIAQAIELENCEPEDVGPVEGIAYHRTEGPLKEVIENRKKVAAAFANVTPEMVLGATALRAFASIDDALDDDGNFDMKRARDTGAIHLVKKLEKTRYGWKVEFYDKGAAQDKLGNYLGMEIAPKENTDEASLKAGINSVARQLARDNGGHVEHRHIEEAWSKVYNWAQESKAKYSIEAIERVGAGFGLSWATIKKYTQSGALFTKKDQAYKAQRALELKAKEEAETNESSEGED